MIRKRDGAFLSSKAAGRKGYGLESVRATAKRYKGDVRFVHDNDKRVFSSSVLLTYGGDKYGESPF
jgi:sensor histidine kinase regulating citrate/malate metabolism